MEIADISFLLAFGAGLLSFFSPCVLPLVPIYLAYLTGSTIGGDSGPKRSTTLIHALLFVLGFTLIFVLLFGAPVGLLGNLMADLTFVLARIGGALLIIFGLHSIGLIRIPALYMEKRLEIGLRQEPGYLRSGFVGMTFAAGWTPCVGPLLGAIITLALQGRDPGRAILLLFVYSMGLGVPFLLTALLLTTVSNQLKRLNRYLNIVSAISGLFLIALGLLLLTDNLQRLNAYLIRLTPGWLVRLL